jgi:LysR family transcriptional regulator, flagellar master operon regulator
MTLEQLQSFIAVANIGSFRAAAQQLHVSQPTVSARIRALEDRLNRALFTRSRAGVTLTAAGHTFRRYAIRAVQTLEQGRMEAMLDERYRGTLAMGVQVYLWEVIVEPWIEIMSKQIPNIALRIEPDYSDGIMHQLVNGLLDLGILFEPRLSSGIVVESLAAEPLWLVSTDVAVTGDSRLKDYVAVYWGQEFQDDFARAYPLQPQPRLAVGLSAIGLSHILSHGGSAVLLARNLESHLAENRLHRVPASPEFKRPVFLAYRESLEDDPNLKLAIDAVHRVLSAR